MVVKSHLEGRAAVPDMPGFFHTFRLKGERCNA
jgi:hypothetical protein